MAKLNFNPINSQGGSWDEVTEHGILGEILNPNEAIRFGKKNLNSNKRVVVFVSDGKGGEPEGITCSEALSTTIRKASKAGTDSKTLLRAILDMRVIETDNYGFMIVPEFTGQLEEFKVAALKKTAAVNLDELVLEDLSAV